MATCSICSARKGKRKCLKGGMVCSQCCGETRSSEICATCSFLSSGPAKKNYRSVPYFETSELSHSIVLEEISRVIESALCTFDVQGKGAYTDNTAMRLIELLLDVHHFKDCSPSVEDDALATMFAEMRQVIALDLKDVAEDDLVKVLAAIYRSILRRTNGGNAYLTFIRRYVGSRLGSGVRVLSLDKSKA
ncbi:MAG: hypothetical protein PHI97_01830 [Desulfobulbus sp.]|nr:hypothetical protein [Desulfobulbus sp.]